MAINKESNGYTFSFAIILVVVVGALLSVLSMGLKPMQEKNEEVKKKLEILKALVDTDAKGIDRSNVEAKFSEYIDLAKAKVLNAKGEVVASGAAAFDIDIKKQYRDKNIDEKDRLYPIFEGKLDGKTVYVIPIVGKGLWGPIWGNVCIDSDMMTIIGASFDHKTETPGLGAEIKQKFFIDRWIKEKISDGEKFTPIVVVKDGSGKGEGNQKVDGITGGTITSKGVEEMANRCLQVYVPYFNSLK